MRIESDFEKVIIAWKEAASDLGLKIHAPFLIETADGNQISFKLLIQDFGCKSGTIVSSNDQLSEINSAKQYGYFFSALNSDSYSIYHRDFFIDTLNDWGFFGDKAAIPIWYTGQNWS